MGRVEIKVVGMPIAVMVAWLGMCRRQRGLIMLTVRWSGLAGGCLANGDDISKRRLIFALYEILNQFGSLLCRGGLL